MLQSGDHFNEELLRIQLEIQEHSLDLMIKEIYENVGQVLSLAKFNLTLLAEQAPGAGKTIADPRQLISQAIKDLRQLSQPVTIREITEKGFLHSLQHELATRNRLGVAHIELIVNDPFSRFDAVEELVLFRIVQESLLIVSDYAAGKTITIKAVYYDEAVVVTLQCPVIFNTVRAPVEKSHTTIPIITRALSSRARLINATCSVTGNTTAGWEIQVRLSLLPKNS